MSIPWELLPAKIDEIHTQFVARRVDPNGRNSVFIAVDQDLNRHVFIKLRNTEYADVFETSVRGLEVRTRDINLVMEGDARYFDIRCIDKTCHDVLDLLIRDCLVALDERVDDKTLEIVEDVIEKWKRFWSSAHRGGLSKEKKIGLFGELWFLSFWLAPIFGKHQSLGLWKGPYGSRHDFQSEKYSLEVKTSTQESPVHTVNGLDQLDRPDRGMLFFVSLRFEEEPSAEYSLSLLIDKYRDGLTMRNLIEFEEALSKYGWSEYDDLICAELRLSLRQSEIYYIEGDFPRLTPKMIGHTVSPLIGNVRYDIRVNRSLTSFVCDNQEALARHLRDTKS